MIIRRLRLFIITALVATIGLTVLPSQQVAQALSGSEFQAGRIIDDGVFFDSRGLSVQDIQTFLNAKMPNCDTDGSEPYNGTTAAAYGTSRGYPPPYICLRDYVQTTVSKPADAYCSGYGSVRQSAAEIIYGVAQNCGVSARALIVLLQKEQGLVTDRWPWQSQYDKATGYGCPDTAACDTHYAGFFNQVYWAARQFKYYAANPDVFNYRPFRNNTILYNPNSACGSSTVFITNRATAGLYNYTPYRPNQAALNNLYGSGDGCSAYGNRNFWRYYNDWFGSTFAANVSWQPMYQGIFTDDTEQTLANPMDLRAGKRYYFVLKAKNTGLLSWQKGVAGRQMNVGTSRGLDRRSPFCDSTWMGRDCNRPVTAREATVAPGETGTFGFWATAPSPGTYNEYFNLVMDGTMWSQNDPGLYWTLRSVPLIHSWKPLSQTVYTDDSRATPQDSNYLEPAKRYYVELKAQNTGNEVWRKAVAGRQVNLGTSWYRDRRSWFCDDTWKALSADCNRPTTAAESTVAPGQTATFGFWIRTPFSPNSYHEYFNLVMDGTTWAHNDPGLYWTFTVRPQRYTWEPSQQVVYTDATRTTGVDPTNLTAGQRYYFTFKAKNTGTLTWQKGVAWRQVNVGTSKAHDRRSKFCDSTWLGADCNRPSSTLENTVAPGQTGTFGFWVTAPTTKGTYNEYFNPVMDGVSWLQDHGLYWTIGVK